MTPIDKILTSPVFDKILSRRVDAEVVHNMAKIRIEVRKHVEKITDTFLREKDIFES